VKTVPLRRLIHSLDNGSWGLEPGESDVDALCVRAADFDYRALRVDLARSPLRSFDARTWARLRLVPGDIVLEKSGGGDAAPVGRAVLYGDRLPAVTSNFAARVRAASTVDPRYLVYVLSSLYSSGATVRCVKQTTGIQNLDTEAWLQTPAASHSLDVQRQIADFLDDRVARIDQIISARRSQQLTVDEAFAAQRRVAVVGQGPHAKATGLPWAEHSSADRSVRRLSQVALMGTGHTPSRSEPTYWVDCDIPWLTTSDVHRFRRDEVDRLGHTTIQISKLGLANSAAVLHPGGTVALSRTASAGFSIVMDQPMATSQDFVTWTCGPELRADFLLHTLRVMRPFLLGNLATGSTHKTIYFPDLMDLRVLMPSLDAQDYAVQSVQESAARRNDALRSLRRQAELLMEYKQSLITAAVTGELDVTTAGSGIPSNGAADA